MHHRIVAKTAAPAAFAALSRALRGFNIPEHLRGARAALVAESCRLLPGGLAVGLDVGGVLLTLTHSSCYRAEAVKALREIVEAAGGATRSAVVRIPVDHPDGPLGDAAVTHGPTSLSENR